MDNDVEIPDWVEPGDEDCYREFKAAVDAKRDEIFADIVNRPAAVEADR